ncbi:hypothetical protein HA402_004646 [Bradysia odoriphaga]|nr:hypothetical protein HA402_004646 [Bradysia odoriphaga]
MFAYSPRFVLSDPRDTEISELKHKVNAITEERDSMKEKIDVLTDERDKIQSSFLSLAKKFDQLVLLSCGQQIAKEPKQEALPLPQQQHQQQTIRGRFLELFSKFRG